MVAHVDVEHALDIVLPAVGAGHALVEDVHALAGGGAEVHSFVGLAAWTGLLACARQRRVGAHVGLDDGLLLLRVVHDVAVDAGVGRSLAVAARLAHILEPASPASRSRLTPTGAPTRGGGARGSERTASAACSLCEAAGAQEASPPLSAAAHRRARCAGARAGAPGDEKIVRLGAEVQLRHSRRRPPRALERGRPGSLSPRGQACAMPASQGAEPARLLDGRGAGSAATAERERVTPAPRETSELIEKLVHMKRKRGGASQPRHERTLLQLALQGLSASAEAAHALPRHFRSRSKLSSAESAASALGLLPELTETPDGGGAAGAASSRTADTNGADRGHDSSSIALRRSARRSHDPPANPPPQQQTQKRRRPNADLMKPPPPTFFVRRQQESNVDLRSKMRHPPKDFSLSTDDKLFFRRAKVKDLDDPSRWLHLDINSSTSSSAGFIMNDEPVSRPEVSYSVIHSIYQTVDGTRWAEHTDFYDLDDFRKQAESVKKNTSQFVPSNNDNQSKEPISSKELFKVRGRRHTPLANIETDDFRIVRKSEYDQLDESDKGEDAFFWRYEFDPRTMERTGTEEDEPRRERQ